MDEAYEKFSNPRLQTLSLYLIGHLQSNKIKKITPEFCGIHSVDSIKKAKLLSKVCEKFPRTVPLEILIQVNTSGEASKSGFRDLTEFSEAAAAVSEIPNIVFKGLMTMAPFTKDEKTVRECLHSAVNGH